MGRQTSASVAMLCKVGLMFLKLTTLLLGSYWQHQDYENSLSALAHFSIDFNAFLPHVLVRGFARQKRAGTL
jgi:hypothetical protein